MPRSPRWSGCDVEHDRDVVAGVPEALAQDAAAGDLEHCEVHPRVLQHHPRRPRAGGVGLDHQPVVDHDAVGRGHADLAAHALEDVRDHPAAGGLSVGAGHRDDRDPRAGAGRKQQVHHGFRDVLRVTDRRVRVHPEARRGVHFADRAAGLADRLGDVGAEEVDAGDVEADDPGGLLGDVDVVRVGLEGAVDGDAAGRHVAGQRQLDHLAARRDVGHLVALLADEVDRAVGDVDAGEHLLVADAAPRVGVGDLHQLGDRLRRHRR